MDIFSAFTLLGGLALFLYGMHVMSSGLEKVAGGKLESVLRKMTSNPVLSLCLGAGITIAIQSSSALTVMLVGLVNSGVMQFGQTIYVLMGSNIGTTLTAWILSLSGIDSDVFWINLLKPSSFSPILAVVGVILIMVSKSDRKVSIGNILVGFAVLMFGMGFMSDAMAPLSEMPEFQSLLTVFSNPILAVLIGAVFTGIIQSSAASVGILQTLAGTGSVTYAMAIPIIMGQNIGTCVTALLSGIGVSKNAKKVAVVHLTFNIAGTVICFIPFLIANYLLDLSSMYITPFAIAAAHTIFNVTTTVILAPFARLLEKFANFVLKSDNDVTADVHLDERLLTVPAFAVAKAMDTTCEMAAVSKSAVTDAITLFDGFSEKRAEEIRAVESKLDRYEDRLGTYLVRLFSSDVDEAGNKKIELMLHTVSDFERIGDHASNMVKLAEELHNKRIDFSAEARSELRVLFDALTEILEITVDAFEKNDTRKASRVEPLEQVIDSVIGEMKMRHISRLKNGNCSVEMGYILTDLLNNCERISDHCSNVAVAMIESQHGTFETHSYLDMVKNQSDGSFYDMYNSYLSKYSLSSRTSRSGLKKP